MHVMIITKEKYRLQQEYIQEPITLVRLVRDFHKRKSRGSALELPKFKAGSSWLQDPTDVGVCPSMTSKMWPVAYKATCRHRMQASFSNCKALS